MKNKFITDSHLSYVNKSEAMGKCDVLAASMDDCINLSIGNPDFDTDQRVIDAAFADAGNGHTGYTNYQGDPEFRAEIAKMYKEDYGMDIKDEQILITSSGCSSLFLIMNMICNPGDEIIVQAPYFSAYSLQIELNGAKLVELPTYEEDDFQIRPELLESLITEKTKAILLNTPSNPTGSCLTVETMEKIAAIAEKHDLLVIADDIYTVYSYQHKFVPFASLPGMMKRTLTINSFSKDYIMCGWRVSNIIMPEEFMEVALRINQAMVFCAPSVSQRAAMHGIRMRKEIQPPVSAEFRKRLEYGAERVNALKNMHTQYPPKGTFYLWINIKDTGMTSQEAQEYILENAHVLMLPGPGFGECGEGYLRASLTVGVDKIKEAFDRIEKLDMFKPE
ncbi:MAG: aminotransferase class I/II-fold pyridoxal phosphate-dependent enzyme [Firmicutes bacterium]|nr:aminotransferase class I/II-fold pyridoxal phosphate-dependent enzyme [Bacillota bacterium]